MKILTNIQSNMLAGIAQSNASLFSFLNQSNEEIEIVGIDFVPGGSQQKKMKSRKQTDGKVSVIVNQIFSRNIHAVAREAQSLTDIENKYEIIIETFKRAIKRVKPDLIVLNGSYFIPWCLYLAAKQFSIPILIHYHGILTKETENWDLHSRTLMRHMEKTFDNDRLKYIFPSQLAKEIVEKEVFEHAISDTAILPNSISDHFFDVFTKGTPKNIGVVGRWADVKNTTFVMGLDSHNRKNRSRFNINVVTDITSGSKKHDELSETMNLHNPMDAQSLGAFYGEMGVVVCPSHFETYGNVPQESVASGTPALISDNMGVADTFRSVGLENLITDFSSVKHVYEKIKEVSKTRIDAKVRMKMRKELSSDKLNADLLGIYTSTAN